MIDVEVVSGYVQERRRTLSYLGVAAAGVILLLLILKLTVENDAFPSDWHRYFPFADGVNEFKDWLRDNFSWLTRGIADGIEFSLDKVEAFLAWLPWPVVILAVALPALKFAGLRLALFCVLAMSFWGIVEGARTPSMWDPAMDTLGPYGCLGLPLGGYRCLPGHIGFPQRYR